MKYPVSILILTLSPFVFSSCNNEGGADGHAKENHEQHTAQNAGHLDGHEPPASLMEGTGYALPGMDHGILQSPINIVTRNLAKGDDHFIMTQFGTKKEKVVNKGHTVEVDYDPGNLTEFDGHIYEFKQFHFHTPSEHLVDGITYPMEMHMVHIEYVGDQTNKTEESVPQYLAIGLLFKFGEENQFLQKILDDVPEQTGDVKDGSMPADLYDLLEFGVEDYYYYKGSLTTPPYTETVNWIVLKSIFEASPEQIRKLNAIEGDNARHIQDVRDRVVQDCRN